MQTCGRARSVAAVDRVAATLGLASMYLAIAVAQAPSPSSPQSSGQPFRAAVEVVQVDAVVTGRDGQPVSGLTSGDFEIREDGVPVDIASFEAVALPPAEPMDGAATSPGTATGSNAIPGDGRLVLIVLDDLTVSADAAHRGRASRVAAQIIDGLGPRDQAALFTTGGRRQAHVDFTSDRTVLRRSLDGLWRTGEALVPGEQRVRVRWETLTALARHLENLVPRRTVVALIGEGMPFPEPTDLHFAEVTGWMRDFFESAARANIAVYPFDPGQLIRMDAGARETTQHAAFARASHRRQVDELMVVASNTGGVATVDTNDLARGVDRLLRDAGQYYRLGYYTRAPGDGRSHDIDVRVRRSDAVVRARSSFVARRPSDGRAGGVAREATLDDLVRTPLQQPGVPMAVTAVPVPAASHTGAAIVVVTEVAAGVIDGWPGLDLIAVAVDDDGQIAARDVFTSRVRASGEGDARVGQRVRIASRLEVGRGRYQVRVALREAAMPTSGAGGGEAPDPDAPTPGSVFVHVDVPDFGRPVALGGLVVGLRSWAGVGGRARVEESLCVSPIALVEAYALPAISAAVPYRLRVDGPPTTFVATVVGTDGQARVVARDVRPAGDDATEGCFVVNLPHGVVTGERATLVVEATRGRVRVRRDMVIE